MRLCSSVVVFAAGAMACDSLSAPTCRQNSLEPATTRGSCMDTSTTTSPKIHDPNAKGVKEDDWHVTIHEEDEEDDTRNSFELDCEPSRKQEDEDDDETFGNLDILIVSTADGSLIGLSKSTGDLIWKQTGTNTDSQNTKNTFHKPSPDEIYEHSESPSFSILEPLVSTTTTTKSFASRDWRTAAVPSLDGKTVYLTAHVAATGAPSADEVTVTTSIPDLVLRTPFVDNRGRIYSGSRSSVAVALDGYTGQILKVISADRGEIDSTSFFQSGMPERELYEADGDDSWVGSDDPKFAGKKKRRRRKVVWVGRVDHTISIHEPRSGHLDVQFSAAEIKSVRDMILGKANPEGQPPWDGSPDATVQHFLSAGTTTATTATIATTTTLDSDSLWNAVITTPPSTNMETHLVATPNGNLACCNPVTGNIEWVSPFRFDAPVAFALDASSGATLPVDIVPDATMLSDSSDYLTKEIRRQYHNMLDAASLSTATAKPDPLVGTFAKTGQLFAIPLGESIRLRHGRHGLLSGGSATASSTHSKPNHSKGALSLLSSIVPGSGGHMYHDKIQQRPSTRRICTSGIANFPSCLVSSSLTSGAGSFIDAEHRKGSIENALVPFLPHEYPDHTRETVPPHLQTHYTHYTHKNYQNQKILRILGSWLPPTLAMIFVMSFELGRRKRQKDHEQASDPTGLSSENHSNCVIQVNQNVILGYGGHGTVVFEGMLEGRKVAVKRMLQAYHASADREISLLIESDGHPNVVRYFLKEVRGEFVYLALELCDLSLHELIGHMGAAYELMKNENWFDKDNMAIPNAIRNVLFQVANGVKHLHSLRIVHRDLKPANILLADSRKSLRKGDVMESVFEIFTQGDYVAKISDMGLGKQLYGQSSYGGAGESSLRIQYANENGEFTQPSIAGPGPGSVGWQAPEAMVVQMPASDLSIRSDNSGNACLGVDSKEDAESPLEISPRTSRSVDIFSLGCIFYSTLVPGSHPFGEWYEREANIMHNKPDLEALGEISIEAFDLVSSMVKRNPALRPTAGQVCDHPYFWWPERRLLFLCDFSDRLETEGLTNSEDSGKSVASSSTNKAILVERNAVGVVGTAWDTAIDEDLVNNVQRFRTYDPSSVRDLLRLIRNKYHHFEELPEHLRTAIGSKTDGLFIYFAKRFPSLLIHCFHVCREILPANDPFSQKYCITPLLTPRIPEDAATTTIREVSDPAPGSTSPFHSLESGEISEATESEERLNSTEESEKEVLAACSGDGGTMDYFEFSSMHNSNFDFTGCSTLVDNDHVATTDAGDVIVWECSTAARTFHNRGWYRPDDDWIRRTDASLRKPNIAALLRCATDGKFRTRLCNHWDASQGTFCPMRKKGKCVFAHGPVELRIKEGKRNRWGKLVDANGDSKNPRHSGGEDTYGAARSIETERKQEGKWNVDKGSSGTKGKKGQNSKKKDHPTPTNQGLGSKDQLEVSGKIEYPDDVAPTLAENLTAAAKMDEIPKDISAGGDSEVREVEVQNEFSLL